MTDQIEKARKVAREAIGEPVSGMEADEVIDAFLAELEREGLVIVLEKPTDKMAVAGSASVGHMEGLLTEADQRDVARAVWSAMIAASDGSEG